MIGKQAPDFTAAAVLPDGEIVEEFHFAESTNGRYALVFFYPLDFTFVCPSELIALDRRMEAFRERGVEVFSVSIDSQFTHHAWREKPVDAGGIGPVGFTMVADVKHEICRSYGVESDGGVAFRGAFVIDPKGIVRAQVVHDLPIGRNIDELLRVVDAIQFHDEHGEVCPAGWDRGDAAMQASTAGVASYLAEHAGQL